MTNKPDPRIASTKPAPPHPGMMGDGTEEQNLGQPGNPAARIKKDEVDAAFAKDTARTQVDRSRHPQSLESSPIKAGPDCARPCHVEGMPMTVFCGDG